MSKIAVAEEASDNSSEGEKDPDDGIEDSDTTDEENPGTQNEEQQPDIVQMQAAQPKYQLAYTQSTW